MLWTCRELNPGPFGNSFATTLCRPMRTKYSTSELHAHSKIKFRHGACMKITCIFYIVCFFIMYMRISDLIISSNTNCSFNSIYV